MLAASSVRGASAAPRPRVPDFDRSGRAAAGTTGPDRDVEDQIGEETRARPLIGVPPMRMVAVAAWLIVTLTAAWASLVVSRECGPGPGFLGAGMVVAALSLWGVHRASPRAGAGLRVLATLVAAILVYAALVRLCSMRWSEPAGPFLQWLRKW